MPNSARECSWDRILTHVNENRNRIVVAAGDAYGSQNLMWLAEMGWGLPPLLA